MCISVLNYSNKFETTGYFGLEPTKILYIVVGKEYISKVLSYSSSFYTDKVNNNKYYMDINNVLEELGEDTDE